VPQFRVYLDIFFQFYNKNQINFYKQSLEQELELEKIVLGFYFSGHPTDSYGIDNDIIYGYNETGIANLLRGGESRTPKHPRHPPCLFLV
jgi:hypothetical protein